MAPKVERLVNLTIALLEARRPLSLEDLRRRTGYYDQSDRESARRMFERDKDELRRLGVPVRTEHDPLSGEAGYVVDRRDYELPDVDLDRDEMAALAVALRVTGRADERLALSKLAARAPDPLATPAVEARVALETQAVDGVADAVVGRQAIRFAYRTGAGQERNRTIDPYGVVLRRGTWYVVGRDHDRDALRAFRLDRLRSEVVAVGPPGAYELPDDIDLAAHVRGPAGEAVDVVLAVAPRARWATDARGGHVVGTRQTDGRDLVRLVDVDPWRLLPWVLGFGADVEVIEPPELRQRVRERLGGLVGSP